MVITSGEGHPLGHGYWVSDHVLQERNRGLKHTQVTEGLDDLEYSLSPLSERDVLDIIVKREERDALWQLVLELPVVEQQVLMMRHKDNLSDAEIAKRL